MSSSNEQLSEESVESVEFVSKLLLKNLGNSVRFNNDDVRLHTSVYQGFNQMTNSILSSPDFGKERDQKASKDRLLQRLKLCDLVEVNICGDGNCQFSSIAEQLFGTPTLHPLVRKLIVQHLKSNSEIYAPFVFSETFDAYIAKMSKTKEWGDNLTLQAASDYFKIKILLVTSYPDKPLIEITPSEQTKITKIVHLSFFSEFHYNAIKSCKEQIQKEKAKFITMV
jgi:hypothetical protein